MTPFDRAAPARTKPGRGPRPFIRLTIKSKRALAALCALLLPLCLLPRARADGEDAGFFRRDFDPPEYVSLDAVHWHWEYRSDTLSVMIEYMTPAWEDNGPRAATCYLAEVRTREDAFFTLTGGESGFTRRRARVLAHDAQAVLLVSGDGLLGGGAAGRSARARDGRVYCDLPGSCAAMLPDGTLAVYEAGETSAAELLAQGAREVFSGGPVLLRDGKINERADFDAKSGERVRVAIGMVRPGHYVLAVSDGEPGRYGRGVPFTLLASLLQSCGCTEAYHIGSGEPAALVFMGELLNGTKARDENGKPVNLSGLYAVPDALCFGVSELVPRDYADAFTDSRDREAE